MVVPYSNINLWFYLGVLYYRLGEVDLILHKKVLLSGPLTGTYIGIRM